MMTTAKTHTVSDDHDIIIPGVTIEQHYTQTIGNASSVVVTLGSDSSSELDVETNISKSNKTIEIAKGSVIRRVSTTESVGFSPNVQLTEEPLDIFKRAVKLRRMDALREHLESSWSLYLTNTGGQTDFQELLPVLVCGPSVFFITFPLNKDLHSHYTVYYEHEDGTKESYQSSSTLLDEILQILATIHTLKCIKPRTDVTLKPKVFLVGTHKDQLEPSKVKERIQEIDKQLRDRIIQTSLFSQGSIEFADGPDKLIFVVNNFDKDDSDFQKIRHALQTVVERSEEFTIRCPSTWLIFSLILRAKHKANQLLSYNDCFTIAQRCGISDREELNKTLAFLHYRLGLVRYFCVKNLNKLVVIDPQILFDSISKLMVNTFVSDHATSNEVIEFKRRGIFSMEVIERISRKDHFKFQPSFEWLLHLLKHLKIAAFFTKKGQNYYFFPSVLCHAPEYEKAQCLIEHKPPPLLIAFKSGFCPRGIPGALIVHLMNNDNINWKLRTSKISRNQVSFNVGPCDITLRIFPTHLQVSIDKESETSNFNKDKEICQKIYVNLKQAMKNITPEYHQCRYYFTFYCIFEECKAHPHPAEIDWENQRLECKHKDTSIDIPTTHKYDTWVSQLKCIEDQKGK